MEIDGISIGELVALSNSYSLHSLIYWYKFFRFWHCLSFLSTFPLNIDPSEIYSTVGLVFNSVKRY